MFKCCKITDETTILAVMLMIHYLQNLIMDATAVLTLLQDPLSKANRALASEVAILAKAL